MHARMHAGVLEAAEMQCEDVCEERGGPHHGVPLSGIATFSCSRHIDYDAHASHFWLRVQGRTLVYWTVYSLDATRCIILHLAATQSLQHAAGYSTSCTLCAGIVAVIALAVSQVPRPALPHARALLQALPITAPVSSDCQDCVSGHIASMFT